MMKAATKADIKYHKAAKLVNQILARTPSAVHRVFI